MESLQNITLEEYLKSADTKKNDYQKMFYLLSNANDIEVGRKVKGDLLFALAGDFLADYLKDDYRDNEKIESFEIFKYLKNIIEENLYIRTPEDLAIFNNHAIDDIKNYLLDHPDDKKFATLWKYCRYEDFTLEEIASLINFMDENLEEKIEIWDRFIEGAENLALKNDLSDEYIAAILQVCFSNKNEYYISEAWGLVQDFDFTIEEYENLIMVENEKIKDHIFYKVDFTKFDTYRLIDIISNVKHEGILKKAWENLTFKDLKQEQIFALIKTTKNDEILKALLKSYKQI